MIKDKKGISGIITAVIMIVLVLVAMGIVWGVISNLIMGQLGQSEACFNNFYKIELNNKYTCYDSATEEIRFSVNFKDIKVDKLLVSASDGEESKSFEITSEGSSYTYLKTSKGNYGDSVKPPTINGGTTYVINGTEFGIAGTISIEIAPTINGYQCESADSIESIKTC